MARILVVEDDAKNVNILRRLLTRDGHELEFSDNRQQAVELALAKVPDLILMDIQILDQPGGVPTRNAGLAATKEIRQSAIGAWIPIIAMSAHNMPDERQLFVASGCNDIVSKPFLFSEMLEVIARNLPPAKALPSTGD